MSNDITLISSAVTLQNNTQLLNWKFHLGMQVESLIKESTIKVHCKSRCFASWTIYCLKLTTNHLTFHTFMKLWDTNDSLKTFNFTVQCVSAWRVQIFNIQLDRKRTTPTLHLQTCSYQQIVVVKKVARFTRQQNDKNDKCRVYGII